MSKNLKSEYNPLILDYYTERLNEGIPKTKIAAMFNIAYGTDFGEATLRQRYDRILETEFLDTNLADIEKMRNKIAADELRIIKEQQKLIRQRAAVRSQAKTQGDKEFVIELFKEAYGEDDGYIPSRKLLNEVVGTSSKEEDKTMYFGKSDLHKGYEYEDFYSDEEAESRTLEFYQHVINEIKTKKLDKVVIFDNGDQIEGAALRASQLARIAEPMTKQAKHWVSMEFALLKEVSQLFPDVEIEYYMVSEDNHSQLRLHKTGRNELDENLAEVMANDMARNIETAQEFGGMTNVKFEFGNMIATQMNKFNVFLAHGHQFSNNPKQIYQQVFHDVGHFDVIFVGHWHKYSITPISGVGDKQCIVVTMPAMVGDTDFGERLHLSGIPGFLEIEFNHEEGICNPRMKRLGLT